MSKLPDEAAVSLQVVSELVESARNNDYTDVVMIHEHRGEPDGLVVCHLPYGPSAYFGIFNTVLPCVVSMYDMSARPKQCTQACDFCLTIANNLYYAFMVSVASFLQALFILGFLQPPHRPGVPIAELMPSWGSMLSGTC